MFLCTFVIALALLPASNTHAQSVTSAAINGIVTDKNGHQVPGANIVAVHLPSGTTYGTSSRQDGRYNLPGLRVGGPYTITASLVGYKKQAHTDIHLQLSQNLDLSFALAEEAIEGEEVVIVGQQSSVFNASRTGAATNVTRDQIDQLPTLSRNFQDYYKQSPYVSGEKGNALGRNSKYNNIQIDGTNFNDVFGLGSTGAPAGQSNVTPISLDAIEEFQLVVSPYDVRQSGFTGAGINAITRSGTNEYKASAFYYGRNEGFAGKTPTTVDSLRKKLAGFSDYQLGGRVGGPILENKLFFFANGEVTRFDQPFDRTFGNPATGTNAYMVSQDSLALLTNYLKNRYGYDPGSFANIGSNRESDKIFLRFDYNLSEDHKLTARWNYLRSSEDNSPSRGRSLTDLYPDNGKYKLDNKTHSFALQLTSVFGNSASNELRMGYVDQFDQPIYYGSPFPALYIRTRATPTSTQEILVLGSEEFRHYNELGQKYFEITNNFTLYTPNHTFTIGGKADLFSFRNLFIPGAFGVYTYNSIAQFLNDAPATSYSFRYSATADPLQEANWGANQFGVYAQDEWTVNSSLKVIAGIRTEIPTYPDKPNYNRAIDSTFGRRTDEPPRASVSFSPRVGFNWAVDEERITQVRGGIGIFYGKFPYVWVGNQYANTGVDFFTVTTPPTTFIPDPYGQPKTATTLPSAEVNLTDRNFKAPSVTRWNIAIDRKLPFGLVATLEGIFSTTQNDVYYENINLKGMQENVRTDGPLTPGGVIPGEYREVWGVANAAGTSFTPQWKNSSFSPGVFLVKNTSLGSNANMTVQVTRNVPQGVNGTVAYTWGRARDINSGNSTTASSGWRFNPTPGNPNNPQLAFSQWDRRHRLMASVSYRHDWGSGIATSIGIFYGGQSGRPFSYMVAGDVNGDGRSDNDLAYIPRGPNDIILMGLQDPTQPAGGNNPTIKLTDRSRPEYALLMAFIEGDDYLKDNRGKISARSGPREPWSHSIDLRLAQEIPTIAGQRFEITLDVLNVLNLLNNEWGWVRNTGVNQTFNLLNFHSIETTPGPDYGKARYTVPNIKVTDGKADPFVPDNILSRWQAQLGIRYTL